MLLDDDIPSEVRRMPGMTDDSPFLRGAKELPDLYAGWDSHQKRWTLYDVPTDKKPNPGPYYPTPATPEAISFFAEAARVAVRRLRNSRDPEIRALASTLREPLTVWLDLMRMKERGFTRTMQMTRWRGGRSIQEFLRSGKIPQDARLTENGTIRHLFMESASLWDDLRDLGFDSGLASAGGRQTADLLQPTPESADDSELQPAPASGGVSAGPELVLPGAELDLDSEAGRVTAVAAYTKRRGCSAASLARAAMVDPSDLGKWKRGSLAAASEKRTRIEKVLRMDDEPIPARRRNKDI